MALYLQQLCHLFGLFQQKLKESAVDDVNLCELWSVACYLIKCECTGWQSETTVYAEESKQKETEQEMIKVFDNK